MRITQNIVYDTILQDIMFNYRRLSQLQKELATGKKIEYPSDDPVGTVKVGEFNTSIGEIGQYNKNIDSANSWMNYTDNALDEVGKIMQRVREITIYGADGALSTVDRNALADEVDELRKHLLQTANTEYNGHYIFAGRKTTTKPFAFNGADEDVYMGDNGEIEREVQKGEKIVVNITGIQAFMPSKVRYSVESDEFPALTTFGPGTITVKVGQQVALVGVPAAATLEDIANAFNNMAGDLLEAEVVDGSVAGTKKLVITTKRPYKISFSDTVGNVASSTGLTTNTQTKVYKDKLDVFEILKNISDNLRRNEVSSLSGIRLEEIDEYMDNLLEMRAHLGARIKRLNTTKDHAEDKKINLTDLLSKTEDVDIEKVIMNLNTLQGVYRASLASGAKIMQMSLMDYMK